MMYASTKKKNYNFLKPSFFFKSFWRGFNKSTPVSLTIFRQLESKTQTISQTCIFPSLLFTCETFTLQRKILLKFWQKGRQSLLVCRLQSLPAFITKSSLAAACRSPAVCQRWACAGTSGSALLCWVCLGSHMLHRALHWSFTCSLPGQWSLLGEQPRKTASVMTSKTSRYSPLLLPQHTLRIRRFL